MLTADSLKWYGEYSRKVSRYGVASLFPFSFDLYSPSNFLISLPSSLDPARRAGGLTQWNSTGLGSIKVGGLQISRLQLLASRLVGQYSPL